ncbi:hypothetical protein ACFQWA_00020 [Streptomyces thermogriseus]|uniref:hypothetical protein n=1 Tax=Streptomyces thermogriseus TaxID=75292 RepID=UPI0031F797C4
MRKRSGRPPKYAAIPNETIDNAVSLDFMALGLLTVLLRHQDGWEITLREIGEKYGYGRDAMAAAMGLLQVAQYVVKVRYQVAGTNQWATDVVVYDVPATEDEIRDLLATINDEPDVRPGTAQVIQPTRKAFEAAEKRREKLSQRGKKAGFTVPSRGAAPAGGRGGEASGAGSAPQQPRKAAAAKPSKPTVGEASGKRMSKKQAEAVRQVEASFPEALKQRLPSYRPAPLRDAILQALDSRTPEALAERIERRWWKHGYEEAVAPGGKGLDSPVGVAVALVRPGCPDPMCEDGVILDTRQPCRACQQRREDRKADRARVPKQQSSVPARWKCRNCSVVGRGEGPEDRLCRTCRQEEEEARAAMQALQERLQRSREERMRLADEQADAMPEEDEEDSEHAVQEAAAAEEHAAQEARGQLSPQEAEELHRLRTELARQYPELAQYSQTG